jgi:hypothetical protein
MTQIINPSELEHLTETELRSKFCDILKDLSRSTLEPAEQYQVRTSLENIRQAILRRRLHCPRP